MAKIYVSTSKVKPWVKMVSFVRKKGFRLLPLWDYNLKRCKKGKARAREQEIVVTTEATYHSLLCVCVCI